MFNGQTVFSESLQKDALYIFYVDENGRGRVVAGQTTQGLSDFNVIEVKDGKVSVILSDCADKVCYGSGVCLPHKMTLKIFYDEWESDI